MPQITTSIWGELRALVVGQGDLRMAVLPRSDGPERIPLGERQILITKAD